MYVCDLCNTCTSLYDPVNGTILNTGKGCSLIFIFLHCIYHIRFIQHMNGIFYYYDTFCTDNAEYIRFNVGKTNAQSVCSFITQQQQKYTLFCVYPKHDRTTPVRLVREVSATSHLKYI